jgi:hypothetical protein
MPSNGSPDIASPTVDDTGAPQSSRFVGGAAVILALSSHLWTVFVTAGNFGRPHPVGGA